MSDTGPEVIVLATGATTVNDNGQAEAVRVAVETKLDAVERFASLEQRLAVGAERMDRIESEMNRNTAMTQQILDVIVAARVGFKVIGGIGTLVKWLGMIAAAALAIYTATYALMHGGVPPK